MLDGLDGVILVEEKSIFIEGILKPVL